jgi:hypothetical protein
MSSYDKAYGSNTVLNGEAPTSMGGNMSTYQSKMSGGQGYGFSGKDISRGVMEFSSYKSGGAKSRRTKRSVKRSLISKSKRSRSRGRSLSRSLGRSRQRTISIPNQATVLTPVPFIDSDRVNFRIIRELPNGYYLVSKGPHTAGKIRISQIFYPGNNFTNDNGIINIPEKTAFLNDMNNRNITYTTTAILNRFTMGQNVSIRGFANGSKASLMVESEDGEIAEVGMDRIAFRGEPEAGKYLRIGVNRDVYLRSSKIPILSEQEEEAPMVFLPSQ